MSEQIQKYTMHFGHMGKADTKELPLIFSAPMVRAILAGRKSMTRRLEGLEEVNRRPEIWVYSRPHDGQHRFDHVTVSANAVRVPVRYHAGDRIWVRETHWRFGKWIMCGTAPNGLPRWRFESFDCADSVRFEPQAEIPREQVGYHKRPSIFMPRKCARIILEVTADERCERVQDITGSDALEEGCAVDAVKEWLQPIAAKAETMPLHWIHGIEDHDSLYCYPCACKRAEALLAQPENAGKDILVDGGWGGEEDGIQRCETCGVILEACLTRYGVGQEMEYHDENGIYPSNEGVYHFYDMLDSGDVPGDEDDVDDEDDVRDFTRRVARIGFRWLWDTVRGPGAWDRNDWVRVVQFNEITND